MISRDRLITEGWREVQLTTNWGYETFWKCPLCSALVDDAGVHEAFHLMVSDSKRGGE